jgi:hypothetical protein
MNRTKNASWIKELESNHDLPNSDRLGLVGLWCLMTLSTINYRPVAIYGQI